MEKKIIEYIINELKSLLASYVITLEELIYKLQYDEKNNKIDLSNLDFSKYKCDVDISGIIVNGNLYQYRQIVKKDLWQNYQCVKGDILQNNQIANSCKNSIIGKIYKIKE